MTARLLIVEDEPTERRSLGALLRAEGYLVDEATNVSQALTKLRQNEIDLVLSDMNLPDADGLSILKEVRANRDDLPIIFLTGYASISAAVQAIQAGASDYISKPAHDDEIRLVIERALERVRLLRENDTLRKALAERSKLKRIIGTDPQMRQIEKTVESVANTRATVLITGESGTGKTMLARIIHERSSRGDHPIVEVNCGALPESLLESELFGHVKGAFTGATHDKTGKFEYANGGTLFLDEISTASSALQIKFLRVLQDRVIEKVGGLETIPVDVRIVLATNVDLQDAVRAGDFREDLYYRINVVTIRLPALRERRQDIPELAELFLRRFALENERPDLELSIPAMERLTSYHWPGNVRELENAMERAVILTSGNKIGVEDLPLAIQEGSPSLVSANLEDPSKVVPLKKALEEPERRILVAALRAHGWNRQRTAQALDVNRTTLFNKMKKYGLLRNP